MSYPFNEGTKLAQIFTLLSDQEWHCGKHELPGTQPAKTIQIIRQNGFDIENKTIFCLTCNDKTVHRRLRSTIPSSDSFIRQRISPKLRHRVLNYYKNIEAITLRKMETQQLEIDHRFPQVRWSKDEIYDQEMPNEEIHKKFQLLTRAHNLWKSRYCEHCKATGKRGTFIGINFFAQGGSMWDPAIGDDDARGCLGCFWYDPDVWRTTLNNFIASQTP